MGTLNLRKGTDELVKSAPPEHGPAFDDDAHSAEVYGMDGVRYVQGKALFNNAKNYVGPAPKEMCLAPLTAEQEHARRLQLIKNKKFFGAPKISKIVGAIPQRVLDAQRENAQMLAVESRSA